MFFIIKQIQKLQEIENKINTLKFDDKLKGIWSIDFMQSDTGKIYLIDMARGFRSAYWDPNKLKNKGGND